MGKALDALLGVLELERIDADIFRGRNEGTDWRRCGSLARSGRPDWVREAATAQLLLPRTSWFGSHSERGAVRENTTPEVPSR